MGHDQPITHLKELGVVAVLPDALSNRSGTALYLLPLILHYMQEIRTYAAFFKLQQVKPRFGKVVAETIAADPGKHVSMAGTHIHWRIIQRYYGRLDASSHPELFEPHVQAEDLMWLQAENQLASIEPTMKFWQGLDYVAQAADPVPVSLNILDVAYNFYNQVPFEARSVAHVRGALWNELCARYLGEEILEHQVLQQLDSRELSTERFVPTLKGSAA
jgi:hypothetical protein